jgi:hypothetical protein
VTNRPCSMSERFFDKDPLTGAEQYFSYDDDRDEITIRTESDVTDIIELNKAQFNEVDSIHKVGEEWRHVARIPMEIYMELVRSGKIHDQTYMKQWLNDKDNRLFRTHPGRV